ncbi:MAG: tetratricopeptide repeat protein [Acidobacteriota bacterium]
MSITFCSLPAIELKPAFSEAYYWRGRARLGFLNLTPSNRKKEAIQIIFKDFDKAIELKPDYAEAYIIRAGVWHSDEAFAEGVGDLDMAMQDCEKGIKLNSKLGAGYYTRGSIKQTQQKLREALADYDKAIQFISTVNNPHLLYYNRGVIKDSLNDYRGAIQEYTKAISLEPNYAPSYLNRGTAKFHLKDVSACDDWNKACSLNQRIGCQNLCSFCGVANACLR